MALSIPDGARIHNARLGALNAPSPPRFAQHLRVRSSPPPGKLSAMVALRHLSCVALPLLFSSACDPFFADVERADSAPSSEPVVSVEPASAAAEDATTEPAPRGPDGACLAACARAEPLSVTDQETCRLTCTPAGEQETPTLARTAVARYERCHEHCTTKNPADRTPCNLDCTTTVLATIDGLSETARTCMSPCLGALGTCEETCGRERSPRATDRETCRLQCEAVARSCIDACGRSAS